MPAAGGEAKREHHDEERRRGCEERDREESRQRGPRGDRQSEERLPRDAIGEHSGQAREQDVGNEPRRGGEGNPRRGAGLLEDRDGDRDRAEGLPYRLQRICDHQPPELARPQRGPEGRASDSGPDDAVTAMLWLVS